MKWTKRCMGAACTLSLFVPVLPLLAVPCWGLVAAALWKTRGGARSW